MAKKFGQQKKFEYLYPSRFGSHSSMINEEKTQAFSMEELSDWADKIQEERKCVARGPVVLEDEFGQYVTDRMYLDTGMADPYRTDGKRIRAI